MAKNKVLGTIGENNLIKDCPVLMPKENMNMFNQICDAADENGKQWENYPNSYKKKICESFALAANKALNELSSNTLYRAAYKQSRILADSDHIVDTDIDTLMKEYDRKKRFNDYADELKRKEMEAKHHGSSEDVRNRFLQSKERIQAERERQANIKKGWETKYIPEIADYILKSRDYKKTFMRFIADSGLWASYDINAIVDFEKFDDFILTYKQDDITCYKLVRMNSTNYLYQNLEKILNKIEAAPGAIWELDHDKVVRIFQQIYNGLSSKEKQTCYNKYLQNCKTQPKLAKLMPEE